MRRCLIIRGLFLSRLLLSVCGWVWTGTHEIQAGLSYHGAYADGGTMRAEVYLAWGRNNARHDGWWFHCWRDEWRSSHFWSENGFCPFGAWRGLADETKLSISYWFITLCLSYLLFYLWPKTRPSINPLTAFPVEPSQPIAKQHGKAD